MASTLTPNLELFKPTPGTAEPFRITDWNGNWDKVDNLVAELIDPALADIATAISDAETATAAANTAVGDVAGVIDQFEIDGAAAIAANDVLAAAAITDINSDAAAAIAANDVLAAAAISDFNADAAVAITALEEAAASIIAGEIPFLDGGTA